MIFDGDLIKKRRAAEERVSALDWMQLASDAAGLALPEWRFFLCLSVYNSGLRDSDHVTDSLFGLEEDEIWLAV